MFTSVVDLKKNKKNYLRLIRFFVHDKRLVDILLEFQ